jgi:hypothetical protein
MQVLTARSPQSASVIAGKMQGAIQMHGAGPTQRQMTPPCSLVHLLVIALAMAAEDGDAKLPTSGHPWHEKKKYDRASSASTAKAIFLTTSTAKPIGNRSSCDNKIYKTVKSIDFMVMVEERFNLHVLSGHRLDPTNNKNQLVYWTCYSFYGCGMNLLINYDFYCRGIKTCSLLRPEGSPQLLVRLCRKR